MDYHGLTRIVIDSPWIMKESMPPKRRTCSLKKRLGLPKAPEACRRPAVLHTLEHFKLYIWRNKLVILLEYWVISRVGVGVSFRFIFAPCLLRAPPGPHLGLVLVSFSYVSGCLAVLVFLVSRPLPPSPRTLPHGTTIESSGISWNINGITYYDRFWLIIVDYYGSSWIIMDYGLLQIIMDDRGFSWIMECVLSEIIMDYHGWLWI